LGVITKEMSVDAGLSFAAHLACASVAGDSTLQRRCFGIPSRKKICHIIFYSVVTANMMKGGQMATLILSFISDNNNLDTTF